MTIAETGPWEVWERADGQKHVTPLNDAKAHDLYRCWCEPTGDEGVIVHHSADGREQLECSKGIA